MSKGPKTVKTVNQLSRHDQAYVDQMRQFGQDAATRAQQGQPWFTGPNATQLGALGQYGDLYNLSGGMYGAGAGAFGQGFGLAGQQGAGNIGQYLNPLAQGQINAMNPMFEEQRQQAMTAAQQQATAAGAYGGSRSAILQAQGMQDVNQAQQGYNANVWSQSYGQGLQALLAERQRGTQLMNAGLGAMSGGLSGMGSATGYQYGIGGDLNQMQQQQAMEQLMRDQAGLGFWQGALGPTSSSSTQPVGAGGNFLSGGLGAGLAAAGLGAGPLGIAGVGVLGGLGALF